MTGDQLLEFLQLMGEEARALPVLVPFHTMYDSNATLQEANRVGVYRQPDGKTAAIHIVHDDDTWEGSWT